MAHIEFQVDIRCMYEVSHGAIFPHLTERYLSSNPSEMIDFYNKFKELGFSNVTSYDWSAISEHVRYNAEAKTLSEVTASAGTIIQVRQVVGTCGHGTIRTEALKIKQKISSELEHCEAMEVNELILRCDASHSLVSFNFKRF